MASVVVLAYSDREGAGRVAVILREVGVAAAVVPEEDERFPERMAWVVRVSEADAPNARRILRAITRERPWAARSAASRPRSP